MSKEKLSYKVIILGDSSVGKTSLFKKIVNERFSGNVLSTIGIDKKTLDIKINTEDKGEQESEISLFDTAGQEKFRTLSVSFIRESKGVLMMYDITNLDSFQNIEKWLNDIKNSLGEDNNYLIILLGNKLDLVSDNIKDREVETEDAEKLCLDNKIFWGGECSVKDISIEDLKNLFKTFIEEIYKKVGNINDKVENSISLKKSHIKKENKTKCC